jgi:hypothetical protein
VDKSFVGDGAFEVDSVPKDDGSDTEVETTRPVALVLEIAKLLSRCTEIPECCTKSPDEVQVNAGECAKLWGGLVSWDEMDNQAGG